MRDYPVDLHTRALHIPLRGSQSVSAGFVLGASGSLTREMVLPCSAGRVSFEQLVPGETQISYSSGPAGIHGL